MIRKALGIIYDEQKLSKLNYAIIIFLYVFSAIMLVFLPKDMPMKWGADGSVNYTLPSIIGVWVLPTIFLLLNFFPGKINRSSIVNTAVYLLGGIGYIYICLKIVL